MKPFSYPKVSSLNRIECKVSNEVKKLETDDELINFDSLPLCFNSFLIMKEIPGHI